VRQDLRHDAEAAPRGKDTALCAPEMMRCLSATPARFR
jgi:hypothetical protein